jgi:hypothetical protein
MNHYCTLADSKYLPQAIALYESMVRWSSEPFTLHVLPMDEAALTTLNEAALPNIKIVQNFHERPEMQAARRNRDWREYCWTCASCLCELLMDRGLDAVTYLDADCFFFADPALVQHDIGERSIAIVPHRFASTDRRRLEPNGLYNVSLVCFRDDVGRRCVQQWAAQCREWCYYRNAPGRFGDQKYLDAWPKRYGNDLAILDNIGIGVAPWNVEQYRVSAGPRVNGQPVILYHFHEYIHQRRMTNWRISMDTVGQIYLPYAVAVDLALARLTVHA